MAGLLDTIFGNINEQQLTRQEVLEHLQYLNEIITPNMSIPHQVKYYSYKIKLGRMLLELDKASVYQTLSYQPLYHNRRF